MHTAAMTQPLATPWRRAVAATQLHVEFERVVCLVVEDHHAPVPRLDARVFEVERIARLTLTADDGAPLEQRVIIAGAEEGAFVTRIVDAVTWATELHAAIVVTCALPPALDDAVLRGALAEIATEVSWSGPGRRDAAPTLDRRRRVA